MHTKLIIVDGHSSVGKSSVSKSVFKQVSLDQQAYWLHEECEKHPIRHGEFSFGALDTAEGMELNRMGMLQKWTAFGDSILASGKVCITEGCFLHAYDRYFIHSIWNDDEIAVYCAQVLETIEKLNPVIVLLHRSDLRNSLEKAFLARGQWWRDLMLRRDDLHVYFKDHVYVDENSMFEAIEFEQMKIMGMFEKLQCAKIKIDTSAEQWDQVVREICSFAGSKYGKEESHPCDLQQYLGRYRLQNGTEEQAWTIHFDDINQCLYTSLFWPYMPMRCTAEDVFELISFPVEIHFHKNEHNLQFSVRGNYDWEYNNQIFIKV
jgi:hypothetical protein